MLFTSSIFFVFLAVTFTLYYLPVFAKHQLIVLITSNLIFYGYGQPWLLVLLLTMVAIDTLTSRKIALRRNARAWAATGVMANLLVLGFFKYGGLLNQTFGLQFNADDPLALLFALPLPIGISFYTFHGISLLVDTFRSEIGKGSDRVVANSDIVEHAKRTSLYLTFFPQLIAGPIVKAHDFYPQIAPKVFQEIDWDGAFRALVVGYFLKTVVADNLSQHTFLLTYPIFLGFSTINLLILLFGYSMQIFADFAGYSLIAIGLALLFGYRLPSNFNYPYVSQTFAEFWTRWHMSLSSWLREYLYYPLGGNRKGRWRTYLNLMIVMGLGGLWHGAAWSYAVWGLWHGTALVIERACSNCSFYRSSRTGIQLLRAGLVFVVVTLGWLLFKLTHFIDAVEYLRAIVANMHNPFGAGNAFMILLYSTPAVAYHAAYLAKQRSSASAAYFRLRRGFDATVLGVLIAGIVLAAGPSKPFIYFQF